MKTNFTRLDWQFIVFWSEILEERQIVSRSNIDPEMNEMRNNNSIRVFRAIDSFEPNVEAEKPSNSLIFPYIKLFMKRYIVLSHL